MRILHISLAAIAVLLLAFLVGLLIYQMNMSQHGEVEKFYQPIELNIIKKSDTLPISSTP